jgi:hypothetical protein
VTDRQTPDRRQVVELLAAYGDRPADTVGERIGSLDLAWLVHAAEQRYGVALDLSDEQLARMVTIGEAVAVLREVLT